MPRKVSIQYYETRNGGREFCELAIITLPLTTRTRMPGVKTRISSDLIPGKIQLVKGVETDHFISE